MIGRTNAQSSTFVAVNGLFNFPLTIANSDPTEDGLREGHIWVNTDIEYSGTLYINNAPTDDMEDNCLIFKLPDSDLNSMSFNQKVKLGKTNTMLNLNIANDIFAESDKWLAGYTQDEQSVYFQKPSVMTKIDGNPTILDAYMWDGTSWLTTSSNGQYLYCSSTSTNSPIDVFLRNGLTMELDEDQIQGTGSSYFHIFSNRDGSCLMYTNQYQIYGASSGTVTANAAVIYELQRKGDVFYHTHSYFPRDLVPADLYSRANFSLSAITGSSIGFYIEKADNVRISNDGKTMATLSYSTQSSSPVYLRIYKRDSLNERFSLYQTVTAIDAYGYHASNGSSIQIGSVNYMKMDADDDLNVIAVTCNQVDTNGDYDYPSVSIITQNTSGTYVASKKYAETNSYQVNQPPHVCVSPNGDYVYWDFVYSIYSTTSYRYIYDVSKNKWTKLGSNIGLPRTAKPTDITVADQLIWIDASNRLWSISMTSSKFTLHQGNIVDGVLTMLSNSVTLTDGVNNTTGNGSICIDDYSDKFYLSTTKGMFLCEFTRDDTGSPSGVNRLSEIERTQYTGIFRQMKIIR